MYSAFANVWFCKDRTDADATSEKSDTHILTPYMHLCVHVTLFSFSFFFFFFKHKQLHSYMCVYVSRSSFQSSLYTARLLEKLSRYYLFGAFIRGQEARPSSQQDTFDK